MKDRKEKKLTKREIALQNLQKANEAKKAKKNQPKTAEEWGARSRARLERIIERAEKELTKADTMEGVDLAKLTNALKVCHQAHRAMKDEGDSSQFDFRTASEAHLHTEKTTNSLVAIVKRLPPGGKRWVREILLKPLAKATGEELSSQSN
jgi:hypothetical protein